MAVCHGTQSARHAVRSVGQWSTINQSHSTYDQSVASATSQPRSRPPNAISRSVSQSANQLCSTFGHTMESVYQCFQSVNTQESFAHRPCMQHIHLRGAVKQSRGANSRPAVSYNQSATTYNQSVTHTHAVRHHSIGLCCRKSVAVTAVCRTHTQCPLTRGISKLHSLPRALGLYYYTQSTHITMIPQSFELVGARCYGPISRGVRPAGHKGE